MYVFLFQYPFPCSFIIIIIYRCELYLTHVTALAREYKLSISRSLPLITPLPLDSLLLFIELEKWTYLITQVKWVNQALQEKYYILRVMACTSFLSSSREDIPSFFMKVISLIEFEADKVLSRLTGSLMGKCLCEYTCTCTYIHVHIHIYMYIHVHEYLSHIYMYMYIVHVCLYICTCTYLCHTVCVYMYMYMCVCTVYVHVCLCTCVHVHVFVYMYVVCVCMCLCVHCTCKCPCTCIHVFTCTYVFMFVCVYTWSFCLQ